MPYPFKKYNYILTISNKVCAKFTDISVAEEISNPVEYREGSPQLTRSSCAGFIKYASITLKWGISDVQTFTDWIITGNGSMERKNVVIQLMNDNGQTAMAKWEIHNAWPSKYSAPEYRTDTNEIVFDSIELTHEGFNRIV